jgi:hypothetical protein
MHHLLVNLQTAELKLLVLDNLLVSLDMSNPAHRSSGGRGFDLSGKLVTMAARCFE